MGLGSPRRRPSDDAPPRQAHRPSNNLRTRTPLSLLARGRMRELSRILEVSGSSKATTMHTAPSATFDGSGEPSAAPRPRPDESAPRNKNETLPLLFDATSANYTRQRVASVTSLPLQKVPERRSSASVLDQGIYASHKGGNSRLPLDQLGSDAAEKAVPQRQKAESPVRRALGADAISSDMLRPSPSRTFIRTSPPLDILDKGSASHERVDMRIKLPSPLFVGGGTIEGQIQLTVDGGNVAKSILKPLCISKLSVDVVGVEEVNDGRRWIFLSLATELFDKAHPPPASLVSSQQPAEGAECYWSVKPSSVTIPFCLNLPLNLGPPLYLSKQASIRYILCPTAIIRVGGRQSIIRQSWTIQMLTVHDPEKALASLASPLLASDSLALVHNGETQHVKLTAGLHRQTWVNGGLVFVDIHIANSSAKSVKRMEVQLEKAVVWYTHPAAGTAEKSANHLRLPRKSDSETISTNVFKKSKSWAGVPPYSSEVRTCELSVPRGHVTISTGRYFEVRYFLNVSVIVGRFKTVAVQLPLTIIPMNSLDILPNSLAQVAASIEAKRARTVPAIKLPLYAPHQQGQAFTAPQRRSLEKSRREDRGQLSDELRSLAAEIDNSPRKWVRNHSRSHGRSTAFSLHSDENISLGRSNGVPSSHHHLLPHPSCYHCHLTYKHHSRNSSSTSAPGPKLPRLQISTSGLGFSDSEFELPPESPLRKVMLSEAERKMINRQRELMLQRESSRKNRQQRNVLGDTNRSNIRATDNNYLGWKNVAAMAYGEPYLPRNGKQGPRGASQSRDRRGPSTANAGFVHPVERRPSKKAENLRYGDNHVHELRRPRSKTNPEKLTSTLSRPQPQSRSRHSVDRPSRANMNIDGARPSEIRQGTRMELGRRSVGDMDMRRW